MARNELGSIRRSQCISTYGPGAIIDFRAGARGAPVSVVAAGLEQWDERSKTPGLGHDQVIHEVRLQETLGVDGFRLPPVAPEVAPGVTSKGSDVLVGVRFPQWLRCPRCHVIENAREWDSEPGNPALYCPDCTADAGGRNRVHVVPVRFVAVCNNGHLDDFPWDFWVEHKDGCESRQRLSEHKRRRKPLTLKGTKTAGLAGLILRCTDCGAWKSMEGCFSKDALQGAGTCRGRRPWLAAKNEKCTELRRIVQRGASNLYFPLLISALDIPPWSERIQKELEHLWSILRPLNRETRKTILESQGVPARLGQTTEALLDQIEEREKLIVATDETAIRYEEYRQLVEPDDSSIGEPSEFEVRPQETPAELQGFVGELVQATRLREVRVLRGFTRVLPPSGENDPRLAKISVTPKTWLPAIEVRGEGVFIQLDMDALKQWETRPDVFRRASGLRSRYVQAMLDRLRLDAAPPEIENKVSPRFLLIHSLAHILIRQLALDCGYAEASLRERLYVGDTDWDMAGLLIYTASADADGTLGGLASQALPAKLLATLRGALKASEWCSSDPLCIEGRASLSHKLNEAACHACLLISETSCEEFNLLLDRAMLVGTPTDPTLGFFRPLMQELDGEGL